MLNKPTQIPASPNFGSGPCKKHPGWQIPDLNSAFLGRSHRAPKGIEKAQYLLDLTRELLAIPDDFAIAIVPGSGTGAVETAMWNFLGRRSLDIFAWDVFGRLWVTDAIEQLPLENTRVFTEDFGKLPDLSLYDGQYDCVFTYNGTSSGVMVPHLGWIPDDRQGLTICDATSSAFVIPIEDWAKLDVTCFSWQKGIGGEAAHGMIVVSPRAMKHLQEFQPTWPIPRLFRLTKSGDVIQSIFEAKTINTPSMLCIEDAIKGLEWGRSVGGKDGLWKRVQRNCEVMDSWINCHADVEHFAEEEASRSKASICFNLTLAYCNGRDRSELINSIAGKLAELEVAYDIKNHFLAPPSFRVWCGPTIETQDLIILTQWLDWALASFRVPG